MHGKVSLACASPFIIMYWFEYYCCCRCCGCYLIHLARIVSIGICLTYDDHEEGPLPRMNEIDERSILLGHTARRKGDFNCLVIDSKTHALERMIDKIQTICIVNYSDRNAFVTILFGIVKRFISILDIIYLL